jgi:Streptomyces sporulation and cell division protein, SsgA
MTRMNGGTTVCAELGLWLVIPGHTAVPLVASLSYRGEDPYAVRMAFHVGMDQPVEWIFARELLIAGNEADGRGEGDVRVRLAPGMGGQVLNIVLSSPFGQALFETAAAPVAAFIRRTYELVPAGREGEFVDVEGELEDLLSS